MFNFPKKSIGFDPILGKVGPEAIIQAKTTPRNIGRYNGIFAELFEDACLVRTTVEARAVIETYIEMDAIAYKPLAM